jgi:hypothetical protein
MKLSIPSVHVCHHKNALLYFDCLKRNKIKRFDKLNRKITHCLGLSICPADYTQGDAAELLD